MYGNLPKPLLNALHMHKRQEYADLRMEVLCMCAKDVKQMKFLSSFTKKRCNHKAASQIDLQNHSAICKNVSCSRESMAESIDYAPAKPTPAKRRRFQTFKKAYHEKWPFVTIDEEGDTCVNSEVHVTVVK